MRLANFPYCVTFLLFSIVTAFFCSEVVVAKVKCNIAAVEVKNFGDNHYANRAAKSYVNMTKKYDHLTYHVVRVKNLQDLQNKVEAEFTKQNCSCITELHIVGHGHAGNVSVGDGMVTIPNKHINGNSAEWKPVLTSLSARLCTAANVFLVGCSTGYCDKGRSKLHEIAKLMKRPVTAPVDTIYGSKIYDYILNGHWQMALPAKKPAHKEKNRTARAPERTVEAGDAYQCSCDNGVYSALQECVNSCQPSLGCYYGICNRVHTNNRWVQYAGNPVMTSDTATASLAGVYTAKQQPTSQASNKGSLVEPKSPVSIEQKAISGWDDYGVSQPAIVKVGPIYQMWYLGWDASNIDRIGYAESLDGITWTKLANNPVLGEGPAGSWDESGAYNPSVIVEETQSGDLLYKMWYTGYSETAELARIGYATSPDGTNWSKRPMYVLNVGPQGAWDGAGVGECSVIKDGHQYKMWYGGSDAWRWWRVGYATSPDGIHWTKHPNNPVLSEGSAGVWDEWGASAPAVVKIEGKFHMLYGGLDSYSGARIGAASSSDGLNWTKSTDNPQLLEGLDAGAWNSENVFHATFFKDNNEDLVKMFYRGTDGSVYGIGYGISSSFTLSLPSKILNIMSGVLGTKKKKKTNKNKK